jgi:hypothetical protein
MGLPAPIASLPRRRQYLRVHCVTLLCIESTSRSHSVDSLSLILLQYVFIVRIGGISEYW